MKNIQRFGAFASLTFGVLFLVLVGLLMTISSQGYTPGSGNDAAKALEFAAGSSVPYIIYLFYALFAVLIVVVILAVTDLLQDDAPFLMRLAVIAAGGTSVLFIAYAMLGYVGEPVLVSLYKQDPALAGTVYMSVRMVSNALNTGAIFTSGWAILLVGLAALRTGRLGRPIAYVLILAGLFAVMSFVVPVFALLAPLLYIVWSIWLGVILLRSQQRRPIP